MQIDFASFNFGEGESIRYQYKLEGSGQDWRLPTESRSVNYAAHIAHSQCPRTEISLTTEKAGLVLSISDDGRVVRSAHEFMESITDPNGDGWIDYSTRNEIGPSTERRRTSRHSRLRAAIQ